MNQIKSIQVGVIAICIATVPLSLAQTPRTRTSGSNQTITTTIVAPIQTGSNSNTIRAPQIGVNPGNAAITGATPNIGTHTAINPGVQIGISNRAIGITSAAAGNIRSSGNSTGVTQTGTNTAAGTNTTTKAQTGTGTDTSTVVDIVQPGSIPALILFTATPNPTPVPTPTPIPSPSVSPSPSPSP